ncbi:MAG: hypothetical protein R2828_05190 [Saprospiraceae bacterium]
MKVTESKTTAARQHIWAKAEQQDPFFRKERTTGVLENGESKFFNHPLQQKNFFSRPIIQPQLVKGQPDNKYQQAANKMGDEVKWQSVNESLKSGTDSPFVQTKCSNCDREDMIQRFSLSGVGEFIGNVGRGIRDKAVGVGERIGEGVSNIYDRVADTAGGIADRTREAGDVPRQRPEREDPSNFCVAYTSPTEVIASKIYLRTVLLPASAGMFGGEVMSIWYQYLSGPSGRHFYKDGSTIGNSFSTSEVIRNRTNHLMRLTASRHHRLPITADNTWEDVAVATVFDPAELTYPINFSNPFDIPGHIAGGVSGGVLGMDSRELKGSISVFREVDGSGNLLNLKLRSNFEFEVMDTVDFCPGGIGAGIEQVLTIPLSRLEASGEAWDVPFQVNFHPTPVEITIIGSALSSGSAGIVFGEVDQGDDRRNRSDRTRDAHRGLEEKERVTGRLSGR